LIKDVNTYLTFRIISISRDEWRFMGAIL